MTTLNPHARNAMGAASREDPQPKLRSVRRILAALHGAEFHVADDMVDQNDPDFFTCDFLRDKSR